MDKLINVLEKKLMPIANKISSIKFLNALGKSFQLLLPIIIIGSFACLGAYIDIPAWTSFIEATGLVNIFNTLFFRNNEVDRILSAFSTSISVWKRTGN